MITQVYHFSKIRHRNGINNQGCFFILAYVSVSFWRWKIYFSFVNLRFSIIYENDAKSKITLYLRKEKILFAENDYIDWRKIYSSWTKKNLSQVQKSFGKNKTKIMELEFKFKLLHPELKHPLKGSACAAGVDLFL